MLSTQDSFEVWRGVVGREAHYEVSSIGRVRTLKTGRILKGTIVRGYIVVGISVGGVQVNCKVHRLVLQAFVGVSELLVDHINGIKTDNRLCNLRYCTARENNLFYSVSHNKMKTSLYPGVYWNKKLSRWQVQIYIQGKNKYLGTYRKQGAAVTAYLEELKRREYSTYITIKEIVRV